MSSILIKGMETPQPGDMIVCANLPECPKKQYAGMKELHIDMMI